MYRIRQNQKREPFGGHHFKENGITMKGDSFDEVVDLVTNFRVINGRVIGDPSREIINYYAKNFPWMVEIDLDYKEPPAPDQNYTRWRDWIAAYWGKPQEKIITRKEASMRWEICKTCPNAVAKTWPDTRESIEFDRKSLMMKRGEKTPENTLFCRLHGADIGISSFVESPRVLSRKDENKTDHPGCWF